jgi:hypothetical protein
MILDYCDFTMGSAFSATSQLPKRGALQTLNWRGYGVATDERNLGGCLPVIGDWTMSLHLYLEIMRSLGIKEPDTAGRQIDVEASCNARRSIHQVCAESSHPIRFRASGGLFVPSPVFAQHANILLIKPVSWTILADNYWPSEECRP